MARQLGQGILGDEGRVAIEDHHAALEPLQRGQGLADRMAGAQLLGLQDGRGLGVQRRHRAGDRLRAVAGHDDDLLGLQAARGAQRVAHHRHAAEPVQDLGQVGLHPAALSRRQYHHRRRLFRHARPHRLFAYSSRAF